MTKKPIIGILPTSNYMLTNDTFQDTYRFGNNYINKIVENGGIPLLIPYINDEVIYDSLAMCDGLLLPGGSRVINSNFDVIKYFYDNKKPILGICLGMQTLGMYSVKMYDKDKRIIGLVDNGVDHWPINVFRDNNDTLVHFDNILKDSIMYEIFGKERIEVNSLHKNCISEVGKDFKVSIYSDDGIIEGIECINGEQFAIGVQFHPEILPQFNRLFERFVQECAKISTK
ncbi:MAG: gamma-glutamyl-gamma-aminobutyrate hydrolase family protein [Candidatus Coprovivens sp.]